MSPDVELGHKFCTGCVDLRIGFYPSPLIVESFINEFAQTLQYTSVTICQPVSSSESSNPTFEQIFYILQQSIKPFIRLLETLALRLGRLVIIREMAKQLRKKRNTPQKRQSEKIIIS